MKLATWTDLWAGKRSDGTIVVWLVVSAVHLVVLFFFFCPRKLPLQGAHGNASVQFLRLAPQINFSSLVLFAVLIDCFCLPPFALNEALAVKMCQLRSRSILVASEPTRALKLRC